MRFPLRIALAASLAVNVFFVGLLAGQGQRPPFGPGPDPRPVTFGQRVQNSLSPESYLKIETLAEDVDGVMQGGFQERDSHFQRLRELVAKEPFDEAEFDRLLAQLPQQRLASEQRQWQAIGSMFKQALPADRQVLSDIFFYRPAPPPNRSGGPPGGPGNEPPR